MDKPKVSPVARIIAVIMFVVAVVVLACVIRHRIVHPDIESAADESSLSMDIGHGVKLDLVRIPTGQFMMGSSQTETGHDPSESPRHLVKIAHDFFIGRYEITQAQWIAVMGANQSQFQGNLKLPAECVSWGDCQKFCAEVSKRTGRTVRLPSEAEWEYACRAGSQTAFAFGDALSSTQACFNGQAPYGGAPSGPAADKTKVVGTYRPNAWGLYDMHGNVWEWCQDVYHNNYTGAPTNGSAWMIGGNNPNVHVYRGGAYDNDGSNCRSAIRYAGAEDMRTSTVGFRVVAEATGIKG